MTPQEIFSKAYIGLTKQGGPSRSHNDLSCMYRAPNGFGCAVGLLVDDETAKQMDHDPEGRGTPICSVLHRSPDLPQWMYDNVDPLMALQQAHDCAPHQSGPYWVQYWQNAAQRVAENFELKIPQELGPNQTKWLAELRSGTYPQDTSYLHTETGFCCLGVGCEVFKNDLTEVYLNPNRGYTTYNLASSCAPDYVVEALGLRNDMGATEHFGESLTALNDGGKTFAEIADLIETLPQEYFLDAR